MVVSVADICLPAMGVTNCTMNMRSCDTIAATAQLAAAVNHKHNIWHAFSKLLLLLVVAILLLDAA
jgi:hypothetical protein